MELNIRDWMIVIGALLFLAVVLDGYRRARRDRQNRVKLSRRAERSWSDDADPFISSELPGSKRRANEEAGFLSRQSTGRSGKAEEVAEVVNNDNPSDDSFDDSRDPLFSNPFDAREEFVEPVSMSAVEEETLQAQEALFGDHDDRQMAEGEPEEIIILHVLAAAGQFFHGEELLTLLLGCDCRFGEMNIFHRYEKADAKGRIQFSIVNSVEPGVFKLDDIKQFSTPGVSFFMRLPGPDKPLEAFDCMVETAQCLARNLNGHMKDENHSTLTEQTLEHGRQRIRDYLQQQLVRL